METSVISALIPDLGYMKVTAAFWCIGQVCFLSVCATRRSSKIDKKNAFYCSV